MSGYGFEVYSQEGVRLLDDKSFSVVGYEVSLPAGQYQRAVSSNFIFVGVKGSELVGKTFSAFFYGNNTGVINIECTHRIDVIFYEYEYGSPSQEPNTMGVIVNNEQGVATFDSRNLHLIVESSAQVGQSPSGLSMDREKVYILHSHAEHGIGSFPIGSGEQGAILGVTALRATSANWLEFRKVETKRIPQALNTIPLPDVPYVGVLTVAHT